MQLHYGVKRDVNRRIYDKLGINVGTDCISNYAPAAEMADYLNALAQTGELPKIVLYSLNPSDNATIGSIMGCFQDNRQSEKYSRGVHGGSMTINPE